MYMSVTKLIKFQECASSIDNNQGRETSYISFSTMTSLGKRAFPPEVFQVVGRILTDFPTNNTVRSVHVDLFRKSLKFHRIRK